MTEQLQIDFDSFDSTDGLTREQWLVWEVIRIHPGEASAITGASIEQITGIPYDRIRAIIRHLITKHNCLIASCSRGYFVPQSANEIYKATKSLRHRGIMILYRVACLQKISLVEIFKQTVLEFKDEI